MAGREDVRGSQGIAQESTARARRSAGQRSFQQRQSDAEIPLARYNDTTLAGGRSGGDERLANGLGWFSIGLGLAQVITPGGVARLIGVNDDAANRNLMRAMGMREIATGVGILSRQRPAGWVKARVAGDMVDLSLLGAALMSDDTQKGRVAFATAAVAGVTALDVLCSQRLAEQSDGALRGGTQEGRTHVAKSITIKRPVEEIYSFWRNFENLPQFMYHLESVEVRGSGRSHWVAKAPAGKTVEWDAETTEDVPNERIAWRSLPDADVPNSGNVEFRPAPGDRGTEIHVQIHYDPPAGKLGAFVAKLFGEEPSQQVGDDLRRLKQVLEVGEVVRSEASPEGQGRPYLAQRPAKHLEGAEATR